jgi:hypothetical protein
MYYSEPPAHDIPGWVQTRKTALLAACHDSRETYKKDFTETIPMMKTIGGIKVQRGSFRIGAMDNLSIDSIRNGQGAIQTLRGQSFTLPISVISLDTRMVGIDGFRYLLKTFNILATINVSQSPNTFSQPLTALANHRLREDMLKALDALTNERQIEASREIPSVVFL